MRCDRIPERFLLVEQPNNPRERLSVLYGIYFPFRVRTRTGEAEYLKLVFASDGDVQPRRLSPADTSPIPHFLNVVFCPPAIGTPFWDGDLNLTLSRLPSFPARHRRQARSRRGAD